MLARYLATNRSPQRYAVDPRDLELSYLQGQSPREISLRNFIASLSGLRNYLYGNNTRALLRGIQAGDSQSMLRALIQNSGHLDPENQPDYYDQENPTHMAAALPTAPMGLPTGSFTQNAYAAAYVPGAEAIFHRAMNELGARARDWAHHDPRIQAFLPFGQLSDLGNEATRRSIWEAPHYTPEGHTLLGHWGPAGGFSPPNDYLRSVLALLYGAGRGDEAHALQSQIGPGLLYGSLPHLLNANRIVGELADPLSSSNMRDHVRMPAGYLAMSGNEIANHPGSRSDILMTGQGTAENLQRHLNAVVGAALQHRLHLGDNPPKGWRPAT